MVDQILIDLAHMMADAAGEIARQYYRQDIGTQRKGDGSPVTLADQAIEKRLREMLSEARPEDGILGEEYGVESGSSGLTWVIDPIDGTKSFIMGRPTFGTLIALWDGDTPLLGVIDQPILQERWVGVQGQTTMLNGDAARVQPAADLDGAVICSTTPCMFADAPEALTKLDAKGRMSWGADCYAYGLLASGHVDAVVEALLKPYDYAALVNVVEGAGGVITDWQGRPLTLQSFGQSDGHVVAAASVALHAEALALLA